MRQTPSDICCDCLPFFSNMGCGFSLLGNEIDGEGSSNEMRSAAGAAKPLRAMIALTHHNWITRNLPDEGCGALLIKQFSPLPFMRHLPPADLKRTRPVARRKV